MRIPLNDNYLECIILKYSFYVRNYNYKHKKALLNREGLFVYPFKVFQSESFTGFLNMLKPSTITKREIVSGIKIKLG
jgi:hypothetical protein